MYKNDKVFMKQSLHMIILPEECSSMVKVSTSHIAPCSLHLLEVIEDLGWWLVFWKLLPT